MSRHDVLIVGAGHAGAQAAIALRQNGFTGSVAMIGEEPELPYERPPLSKEYLAGDKAFERMLIRPPAFWEERHITMLPGREVTAVHPSEHAVTANGERIGYGSLIWATGGKPRALTCPGATLPGVQPVRTRADIDAMLARLPSVTRVAIAGGGYIGLEAAAVLARLGKQVILVEALDRVLARVAGEPLSRFFEAEHRAHGVDIRLNTIVEAIEGEGEVTAVRLSTGETIPAGLVIAGVGIAPAVQPLLDAGAAGGNGVLVDAQCRTSLPDIYAAGDCALHANRFAGEAPIRLESVQNANDQASTAAKTILGIEAAYDAVPWFWSNQYDLRLQTAGIAAGHDAIVLRGDPATRSFSLVYLRAGRVIALDCVNRVKDFAQGRALVLAGAGIAPERLADASTPLKEMT